MDDRGGGRPGHRAGGDLAKGESDWVTRVAPLWFLAGSLLVLAVVFIPAPTVVTPAMPPAVYLAALVAGIAGTLAAVGLIRRLKLPLRRPRLLAVLVISLMSGLVLGALTFVVADHVWQWTLFHGGGTRSDRQFVIARAYVMHSRGTSYHIQLSPYFADMEVRRQDYLAAFGPRLDLHPTNICLQAPVQQQGAALRILQDSSHPFPPGHLTRCGPPPGSIARSM